MEEPSVTMPSSMRLMRLRITSHRWLRVAAASVLCAIALALPGCWISPPKVLTTPDNPVPVARHFPSALLAEPIQLRMGYTHTTQPFTIKGPDERWTVAIGFVRNDQGVSLEEKLKGASNTCLIETLRPPKFCRDASPGFNLQWELLREDGAVASRHALDSLSERSGGTYSGAAITRTLSGFRDQPPGQYRLRVSVLRDAKELDLLKPHILIDRPFFSSRAIE
ncbi:hypothetical protein [Variovorax sp. RA8]|uniref:hypothetical protein n=1 Tax=Variovorax sp. (strain JCM 16519 / RA8) TaxID=662548 RepID=UPI000AEDFCE8|nr:hypothetical protein [Variovorax sp. RA8]VTU26274.1 hypothetical protein RA8CHR_03308 [Variovorax sp. RA8]